jgi:hypothetical protein
MTVKVPQWTVLPFVNDWTALYVRYPYRFAMCMTHRYGTRPVSGPRRDVKLRGVTLLSAARRAGLCCRGGQTSPALQPGTAARA